MKCPNCGAELSPESICEECGWAGSQSASERPEWPELPVGHSIAERFTIVVPLDTTLRHAVRVYLATDQRTGHVVTVKEALGGSMAGEGLQRERGILEAFSHLPAPQVLEFLDAADKVCLVLQPAGGVPLDQAWQKPNVSNSQRLGWLVQLCDALHELHVQAIAYLAIHPQRLLVADDGRLVLADFSQAHHVPIRPEDRLIGFEYYSAPEVFLTPSEVTTRADIYALGATWYALLLGKPLSSEQFEGMAFAKFPLDFLPDLLPSINSTIAKAMQRLPERRHKSVLYLRDAFEEIKKQITQEPSPAVGVYSDTGIVRDVNEDYHLVEEFAVGDERTTARCGLYLISDGMGGEAGGAVASRLTTQAIADAVLPKLKSYHLKETGQDLSGQIGPFLQDGINRACTGVYNRAREDPLLRRMGATVVIAALLGRHLYVANVGDSRAYVINQGRITQMTQDHTRVAQLIAARELDANKARNHSASGQLTRNIGNKPQADAHFRHRELYPGDSVLLCCDGLTDTVEDEEIQCTVLEAASRQEACHRLINLANARGGHDNVTVILTGLDGEKDDAA